MQATEPIWLGARTVASLLEPGALIAALEEAFLAQGRGEIRGPVSTGIAAPDGVFHAKGAAGPARAVFKVNGNFPRNPTQRGLPTIQGVIVLADAQCGSPLAVLDSGEITAQRTAAATAVAARRLASQRARALIVGCGVQGWAHARYLRHALGLAEIVCYDLAAERAAGLAERIRTELNIAASVAPDLETAARGCGIVVTCTTAERPILRAEWIAPGAFVAAVGADNPAKQELDPELLGGSRVVVDDLEQCAKGGELRHALALGVIGIADVAAALHQVVSGIEVRKSPADRVVFDSTGIALEDLAAASLVYEKALRVGAGTRLQ
jgi:ornithine cyclodeaminase/alanine dehydrogenase-like protein (mu-crystallin family)